jgi:hypothetical protein
MACDNPEIPEYLHWDQTTKYKEKDFKDDDKLYRIGKPDNPIEFPSTLTAYSCKWSQIIKAEDILRGASNLGTAYHTAVIQDIKSISLTREKNDGGKNIGFHIITCVLGHCPKDCDFSHSEILIRHRIFSDESCNNLIFDDTYDHQKWGNKTALLAGKGFYKQLRSDYRCELIKVFAA